MLQNYVGFPQLKMFTHWTSSPLVLQHSLFFSCWGSWSSHPAQPKQTLQKEQSDEAERYQKANKSLSFSGRIMPNNVINRDICVST